MIASRPPIRRFATIDNLIKAGKYPNARILSERMEVSERTILRDIEYRFDPGMSLGILANDIRYGR